LNAHKREKLHAFRKKVENDRVVSYWSNSEDLANKVLISLKGAIETQPRLGWEKALEVSNTDIYQDLIELKKNCLLRNKSFLNLKPKTSQEREILGQNKFV